MLSPSTSCLLIFSVIAVLAWLHIFFRDFDSLISIYNDDSVTVTAEDPTTNTNTHTNTDIISLSDKDKPVVLDALTENCVKTCKEHTILATTNKYKVEESKCPKHVCPEQPTCSAPTSPSPSPTPTPNPTSKLSSVATPACIESCPACPLCSSSSSSSSSSLTTAALSSSSSSSSRVYLNDEGLLSWDAGAFIALKSYIASKQYKKMQSDSLLSSSSSSSTIESACSSSRFLLLPEWGGGFFSRMHVMSFKYAWTLSLKRIFVITSRRMGADSTRGMLDYIMPITACEKYLEQKGIYNMTTEELTAKFRLNDTDLELNPNRIMELDDVKQQFIYIPERTYFTKWTSDEILSTLLVPLLSRLGITWASSLPASQLRRWVSLILQQLMFQPRRHIEMFADSTVARIVSEQDDVTPFISDVLFNHKQENEESKLNEPLSLVSMHIRRGDKMTEDPYWRVHHTYRPLTFWTDRLLKLESTMEQKIKYIFVATDDIELAANIVKWAKGEDLDDDAGAVVFANRTIIFNPMCSWVSDFVFTSAGRSAFDCFMVEFLIMIKYSLLLILNPNSNVSESVREIMCAYRYRQEGCKLTEVVDAE